MRPAGLPMSSSTGVACESVKGFPSLSWAKAKLTNARSRGKVFIEADLIISPGSGRLSRSNPMKALQNLAHRVPQRDGPAMRAAHRILRGRERRQKPLHFRLVEARVDL